MDNELGRDYRRNDDYHHEDIHEEQETHKDEVGADGCSKLSYNRQEMAELLSAP